MANDWLKNVIKSVGMSVDDRIKGSLPRTIDFINDAADKIKDARSSAKESKSFDPSAMSAGDAYAKVIKNAISYAKEDLKSGKFYNRERLEKLSDAAQEASMELDDLGDFEWLDADMDSDFEDGFDFESSATNGPSVNLTPVVQASNATTQAIMDTADASIRTNIKVSEATIQSIGAVGDSINRGLSTINENMGIMISFSQGTVNDFMSSSLSYQKEALNLMGGTLSELKKLTTINAAELRYSSENKADIVRYGLDFDKYIKLVKSQVDDAAGGMLGLITELGKMSGGFTPEGIEESLGSPIKIIMDTVLDKAIPKIVTESMEKFDNTFEEFIPTLLAKLAGMGQNETGFKGMIGKIFGVTPDRESDVNLSRYEKGAVPFDGYIRKSIVEVIPTYLRKILAAVSGKEEVGFNYKTGKFDSVAKLRKEFQQGADETVLSSYRDIRGDMSKKAKQLRDANGRSVNLDSTIDQFLLRVSKENGIVTANPNQADGKQVRDILGSMGLDAQTTNVMEALFKSLSRSQQMAASGSAKFNAGASLKRYMEEAESNTLESNAQYSFDNSNKYSMKPSLSNNGHTGITDKHEYSSLNYLYDIRKILLSGVKVWLMDDEPTYGDLPNLGGSGGGSSNPPSGGPGGPNNPPPPPPGGPNVPPNTPPSGGNGSNVVFNDFMDTEEIERMLSQTDNVNIDQNNANANTSGRRSFKEWLNDILNKPANLIAGAFQKADDMLYKILFGDSNDDGTDGSFTSRTLDIVQEKFNAFSQWIHDKLLDPIREKLFGEDGLFDQIKNTQLYQDVREKAVKIKDDLLGMKDENGVRSGGILSDTANELGDIFKEAGYFFGGREYIDSKGVTHPMNPNSVLGEIKSSFSEVGTAVKTQLFGNKGEDGDDENKEGVITRGINSLQTGFQTIADAMFGPKTYTGKDGKEYLNVAYVSLQDFNKSLKEKLPKGLAAGVIGGGAAMLSGGNLGLLGSLFLPGGPIGGAIVGTAVGLLSQSDSFKNFLFGEKDEETGARIGGLISEKTQKFFKENKTPIIAGAGLGMLKTAIIGNGFLPSMLLPGGPIGGAILGVGGALLKRSDAFQKLLYGEVNEETGKRDTGNGIIGKLFGGFNNGNKKKTGGVVAAGALGGAGIAAVVGKMGLMGAMLTPLGPLGGAMVGAAAGIAASSDKWREAVFGKFNEEEGVREGGLLGKITNFAIADVFSPLKLKFQEAKLDVGEWFKANVGNKLEDAIEPLKTKFTEIGVNIANKFSDIFESIKQKALDAITPAFDLIAKKLVAPFKNFTGLIFKILMRGLFGKKGKDGKRKGGILALPFKTLGAITNRITGQYEKRGLKNMRKEDKKKVGSSFLDIFRGATGENGEALGLGQRFAALGGNVSNLVGDYFSSDRMAEAKKSGGNIYRTYWQDKKDENGNVVLDEKGRPVREKVRKLIKESYIGGEAERRATRGASQAAEFKEAKDELERKKKLLKLTRKLGVKGDWVNKAGTTSQNALNGLFATLNLSGNEFKDKFGNYDFDNLDDEAIDELASKMGRLNKKKKAQLVEEAQKASTPEAMTARNTESVVTNTANTVDILNRIYGFLSGNRLGTGTDGQSVSSAPGDTSDGSRISDKLSRLRLDDNGGFVDLDYIGGLFGRNRRRGTQEADNTENQENVSAGVSQPPFEIITDPSRLLPGPVDDDIIRRDDDDDDLPPPAGAVSVPPNTPPTGGIPLLPGPVKNDNSNVVNFEPSGISNYRLEAGELQGSAAAASSGGVLNSIMGKIKNKFNENKADEKQEEVSSKNYKNQIALKEAEADRNIVTSKLIEIDENTENISLKTEEQNNSWSSIFGKKGLMTVGILAAVAAISKLVEWFTGGNGVADLLQKLGQLLADLFPNGNSGNSGENPLSGEDSNQSGTAGEEVTDYFGFGLPGDNMSRTDMGILNENGYYNTPAASIGNYKMLEASIKAAPKIIKNLPKMVKGTAKFAVKHTTAGKLASKAAKAVMKTNVGKSLSNTFSGVGNNIKNAAKFKVNSVKSGVKNKIRNSANKGINKVLNKFMQGGQAGNVINAGAGVVDDVVNSRTVSNLLSLPGPTSTVLALPGPTTQTSSLVNASNTLSNATDSIKFDAGGIVDDVDNVVYDATDSFKYVDDVDDAADAAKKAKKGGKLASKVKSKVSGSASKVKEVLSGTKAGKLASGVADVSSNAFTKGVNKLLKIMTDWANSKAVQKVIGSKAGTFIKTFTTSIISKLKGVTGSMLQKFGAKVAAATAKGAATDATTAATLGISEVVEGVWNASTGALDAANLFHISNDAVTPLMRLISGAMKTLIGVAGLVGALIDVFTEIIAEISGFSLKEWIATELYKLAANDEDDQKLEDAKAQFDAEYEKYKEETGNEDLSREAYNDMTNKTTANKIADTAKGAVKAVKSKVSKLGGAIFGSKETYFEGSDGNKYYDAGNGQYKVVDASGKELGYKNKTAVTEKDVYQDADGNKYIMTDDGSYSITLADGTEYGTLTVEELQQLGIDVSQLTLVQKGISLKEVTTEKDGLVQKAGKGLSNLKDKIGTGLTNLKDKAGAGLLTVKNKIGEGLTAVKDKLIGGTALDNSNVRAKLGLEDDEKVSLQDRFSVGSSDLINKLTFGKVDIDPKVIYGGIETAKEKVKGFADELGKNVTDFYEKSKEKIGDGLDTANKSLGGLLGFTDENGEPLSLTEGVSQGVENIKKNVSEGWKNVKDGAKDFVKNSISNVTATYNSLKTKVTTAVSDMDKGLGSMLGLTDENGEPMSLSEGVNQGWQNVKAVTKSAWKNAKDGVKSFVSSSITNATNTFNSLKTKVTTAVSDMDKGLGNMLGLTDEEGNSLSLSEGAAQGWQNIKDASKEAWKNIKSGAKDFIDTAKQKATSFFDSAKDGIVKGIESVDAGLGSMLGLTDENGEPIKISEGVKNLKDGIVKGWTDTVDNLKTGWSTIKNSATDWLKDRKESFSKWWNKLTGDLEATAEESIAQRNADDSGGNGGYGVKRVIRGGKGGSEVNGFTYYSQNDPRWGNNSYNENNTANGQSTISASGCGPTAMAMTIDKLTGQQVTPDELSKFAEANGYRDETGTNWNFVNAAAKNYGLTPSMRENPSAEFIDSQLNAGKPVVLSGTRTGGDVGSSPYTSEGHYVVAVGKDKNGNVLINDPRGKSYSKAYSMDVIAQQTGAAWGFSKGGGLGPIVSKLSKSKKKRGGRGVSGDWLSIVKTVKAAIATQQPGYDQEGWISVTCNGKTLKVRTDCSGFVGACLKFYGAIGDNDNYSSYTFAKRTNSQLSAAGFTSMPWSGWDNLLEGDIIAKNGHVEIFARNENGTHYVYNCGSNKSVNNPAATATGHKEGYTTVWRPANAGTGSSVTVSANSGSSLGTTATTSSGSILDQFYAPISNIINQLTGSVSGTTTTTDSTSSFVDTVSAENLSGSDNAEKVWNFFTQNGYSKAATAGIMGNLYQESGMNPERIQGNGKGPAAGIAQWENYNSRSGRWKNLDRYASSKGKSWKDLGSQLEFMHKELSSKDLAVFWKKGSALEKAGADPTSYEEWKQSSNVEMATRQFEGAFERAGTPAMSNRLKYANSYYNQYANTTPGGSGGGFGEGDSNVGSYSSDTLQKTSGIGTMTKINTAKMKSETKSEVDAILKEVLSYLKSISENTGSTSAGIQTLNKKGFNIQTSSKKGGKGETESSGPVILPVQGGDKSSEKIYDSDYDLARQISLGRI